MEVTINIDGQALSVEVTVEVYEYLDRADHKEENNRTHKIWYHKAYYSLDCEDGFPGGRSQGDQSGGERDCE